MISALAARFRPNDFFLGRWSFAGHLGTLRPCGVPKDGVALVAGRQSSGKSVAVAIPNILLHENGPALIFDVKGELARACVARRGSGGQGVRGLGQFTYVFDPLAISGLPSHRYNPLVEIREERDTDSALELAMKLAQGLLKPPDGGSGENAWVYSGGAQVAYGLVAYLLSTYPPELQNLVTLRQLLQEGETAHAVAVAAGERGKRGVTPFEALLQRMQKGSGRFATVSAAEAANIEKMGDRQLGSIFSALVEATAWLDLPKFQHAVTGCDFRLRDFMTERISVFVCLPLNELVGFAGGIMRVILSMFLQTMYQKNPFCKPLPHGPALCLVDEAPQFRNVPGMCQIAPTMRDYQVKLMLLMQDLGQLSVYGKEEAQTLIGCSAYVQILGMKHVETLDWLVAQLGERCVRERQPDGRTVTKVYPLLDRQQAAHYLATRAGNQIVLRGDDRPMRLRNANYWWFLPYWMYTPDMRHPEPWLRAWMRRRAIWKEASAKQQELAGEGGRHHASAIANAH